MAYQGRQQLIFIRRQVYFHAESENPPGCEVDFQIAAFEAGFAGLVAGPAYVTECNAEAQQELARAKWLCKIVICTIIQGGDLLFLLIASREHNNGSRQPFAQSLDGFLSVHIGKAQIKNDGIRRKLRRMLQCLSCRTNLVYLIVRSR